jgi:hypothetical protein
VYFFGVGQGGSIQDNIDRSEGQFKALGGKPAPAQVIKITVHGLPVTIIEVSGDYSGMAGPLATAPVRVFGYRLLGAIVESPGGNVVHKVCWSSQDYGRQPAEVSAVARLLREGRQVARVEQWLISPIPPTLKSPILSIFLSTRMIQGRA